MRPWLMKLLRKNKPVEPVAVEPTRMQELMYENSMLKIQNTVLQNKLDQGDLYWEDLGDTGTLLGKHLQFRRGCETLEDMKIGNRTFYIRDKRVPMITTTERLLRENPGIEKQLRCNLRQRIHHDVFGEVTIELRRIIRSVLSSDGDLRDTVTVLDHLRKLLRRTEGGAM